MTPPVLMRSEEEAMEGGIGGFGVKPVRACFDRRSVSFNGREGSTLGTVWRAEAGSKLARVNGVWLGLD